MSELNSMLHAVKPTNHDIEFLFVDINNSTIYNISVDSLSGEWLQF